jgi:hypothetical protein
MRVAGRRSLSSRYRGCLRHQLAQRYGTASKRARIVASLLQQVCLTGGALSREQAPVFQSGGSACSPSKRSTGGRRWPFASFGHQAPQMSAVFLNRPHQRLAVVEDRTKTPRRVAHAALVLPFQYVTIEPSEGAAGLSPTPGRAVSCGRQTQAITTVQTSDTTSSGS